MILCAFLRNLTKKMEDNHPTWVTLRLERQSSDAVGSPQESEDPAGHRKNP